MYLLMLVFLRERVDLLRRCPLGRSGDYKDYANIKQGNGNVQILLSYLSFGTITFTKSQDIFNNFTNWFRDLL